MAVNEVTSSAEPMVPAIARLVEVESADPSGSRPMAAEVPNTSGNLVDDADAKDALRAALRGLDAGSTIAPASPDRRGQGSD
jgi:hypothetical protein